MTLTGLETPMRWGPEPVTRRVSQGPEGGRRLEGSCRHTQHCASTFNGQFCMKCKSLHAEQVKVEK